MGAKRVAPNLMNPFCLSLVSAGRREPCSNEGEEVAVPKKMNLTCFKCICQVSFCIFSTLRSPIASSAEAHHWNRAAAFPEALLACGVRQRSERISADSGEGKQCQKLFADYLLCAEQQPANGDQYRLQKAKRRHSGRT